MKRLMLSLALLGTLSLHTSAWAAGDNDAPAVQLTGSIVGEYRIDNNGAANPVIEGFKTYALVNIKKNVNANLSLFARASYENISNTAARRAFADYAGSNNNGSIDSFGCQYENAGYKYKLGTQPFVLGPTALLYDGSFAVGRHSLPLAVNMTGKVGATDVTTIVGRTNYYTGNNDKLFVVQGSYGLNAKSSFGAVWARVGYGLNGGYHNYNTVSFSHTFSPKVSLTVEYLKADFNKDNIAYTEVINFDIDDRNSLCLADWRVEQNASILDRRFGYMTTYLGDAAGQMLVWQHRITKDLTLAVVDLNFAYLHDNRAGGRQNSFRTKLIYCF